MSSFSWGCRDDCSDVTWGHVVRQVAFAGVPWVVLTTIGVVPGLCCPVRVKRQRVRACVYECGLTSSSSASACAVLSVHLLQCVVFMMRSAEHQVDTIYHAMEMIGTLIAALDCCAHFFFISTFGWRRVLRHALFGQLIVDCLVITAVFALGIEAPPHGKTWFSFSFLGAVRMGNAVKHIQDADAYNSTSSWRRQIIYSVINLLLFVYAAAAVVLTLEHLGTPQALEQLLGETPVHSYRLDSLPYSGPPNLQACQGGCKDDTDCAQGLACFHRERYTRVPNCIGRGSLGMSYCYDPVPPVWDFPAATAFIFSTMSTIGNTPLMPQTIYGRIMTIYLMGIGFYIVGTKMLPIWNDVLLGHSLGLGAYHPRKAHRGGHLLVVGTPSARMLADLLKEVFHPNHFDGVHAFDNDSPDVVILIPSEATLSAVRRICCARSAILYRHSVFGLKGDPFNRHDLDRACLDKARMVIVLPNLLAADVFADDSANMMRSFAIGAAAPHVRVQCLLQRAEHDPAVLSKGGSVNMNFTSVDGLKMSLLAKACLTKGSLALLTNLCVTAGSRDTTKMKAWQRDYEHSISSELYEVPLSPAYHGETFADTVLDVLARSIVGEVYLIGIIREDDEGERNVFIHPTHEFVLKCEDGRTCGIFIAPDVSAIMQRGDEENESFWDRFVPRLAALDVQTPREQPKKGSAAARSSARAETGDLGAEHDGAEMYDIAANIKSFKELLDEAEGEMAKKRAAENEIKFAAEQYGVAMLAAKKRLLVKGIAVETVNGVADALVEGDPTLLMMKKDDVGNVREADDLIQQGEPLKPFIGQNTILYTDAQRNLDELEHNNKLRDAMERIALHAAPVPSSAIGGHILLCIVSDSTCGVEMLSCIPDGLGPAAGIAQFMKPLRDRRIKGREYRPPVVVLAMCLPMDWHSVLEYEHLYFVRGSPLEVDDLERAGFKKAKTIAIARGHLGGHLGSTKVADARVLLLCNFITSHLPRGAPVPIVTDLSFDGSCFYLPKSTVPVEPPPMGPAVVAPKHVGRLSDLMDSSSDVAEGPAEEDYESLLSLEYQHHHRFMTGQIFVASSVTALIGNTLYNEHLLQYFEAMIQAPMLLLPLPAAWEKKTYALLVSWLLKKRNLLALGLIRSSQAAEAGAYGTVLDESIPSHTYMFTAPPAYKTIVVRSDRILCIAPTRLQS